MFCVGIVVVVPTVTLLLGSFMELFGVTYPGGDFGFTVEHWQAVLKDDLFLESVIHTVELGLGAAAIGVLVFSMIAYLIIRSKVAGRDILDVVVWLPWAIAKTPPGPTIT